MPSDMNVADDATRDVYPPIFEISNRWLNGPSWLSNVYDWPVTDKTFESTNEEKKAEPMLVTKVVPILIDWSRFSSYNRARRAIAWALRWIGNVKEIIAQKKSSHLEGCNKDRILKTEELAKAEQVLCKLSQNESFSVEINRLQKGEFIPNNSKILSLSPFIDFDGVLKVNGRTNNATALPMYTKQPIILDKNHALTTLIINYYHIMLNHLNEDTVICEIRRKFWIAGLRQKVRQVKNKCMKCRIDSAKASSTANGSIANR